MATIQEKREQAIARLTEIRETTEEYTEATLAEVEALETVLETLADVDEKEEADKGKAEDANNVPDIEKLVKEKGDTVTKSMGAGIVHALKERGGITRGETVQYITKAGNANVAKYPAGFTGERPQSVFTNARYTDYLDLFNVIYTDNANVNVLRWTLDGDKAEEAYQDKWNAPKFIGDADLKPQIKPEIVPLNNLIKKVGGHIVVSDTMLEDEEGLLENLEAELANLLIGARNAQLLHGDGEGNNLAGLRSYGFFGNQSIQTIDGKDFATIAKAYASVASAGFTPDTLLVSPSLYNSLATQAGQGFFPFWNNAPFADGIYGLRVVIDPMLDGNAGASTAYLGAFKQGADVYARTDINVEATNTNEDNFIFDLTTIRVWQRLGLNVKHTDAFVEITGQYA